MRLVRPESPSAERSGLGTPPRISADELQRRLEESAVLLRSARPHLEWIAAQLPAQGGVIYLVDHDAVVLWSSGTSAALVEEAAASPGTGWSEKTAGSNAAGSAIAADEPLLALGSEDAHPAWHRYDSLAVPLHGRDGEVLGAVVSSSPADVRKSDRLALSAYAAFATERDIGEREAPGSGVLKPAAGRRIRWDEKGKIRRLLDSVPDPIVMVDEGGAILYASSRCEHILGYPPTELLGRPVESVIPLQPNEHDPAMGKNLEVHARRRDGEQIPVEITLNSVAMREGRFITAAIREGSTRREALRGLQRQVGERTEETRAAVREINALSDIIAHDLRGPLRAIASGAQIILEEQSRIGEEARHWAERIAAAANRMDSLVLGLLEYSRLAWQDFVLQTVDLEGVVKEVLSHLDREISGAKARIVVEGPLPPVRGHPVALAQALGNLVSNAIKFVAEGVLPTVRIHAESRRVPGQAAASGPCPLRIWVEDNGVGIAPGHQQRIFGVFERLHRREEYGGAGIGLAIAKRLVERMGGKVGVESEAGRGSRFYLELPEA